ncbi:hypothetical protein [Fulvivirga ligni]|uniref:hypothetical protein n=1 Tax=Fulvivirga ligni TaxID=2904246 RepID=UPI001F1D23BD|nr:hypothetical protein [Fulvivirga ligni]UII21356.1 hypothetical protein LVD16_26340 [Fulvivirga ligni]
MLRDPFFNIYYVISEKLDNISHYSEFLNSSLYQEHGRLDKLEKDSRFNQQEIYEDDYEDKVAAHLMEKYNINDVFPQQIFISTILLSYGAFEYLLIYLCSYYDKNVDIEIKYELNTFKKGQFLKISECVQFLDKNFTTDLTNNPSLEFLSQIRELRNTYAHDNGKLKKNSKRYKEIDSLAQKHPNVIRLVPLIDLFDHNNNEKTHYQVQILNSDINYITIQNFKRFFEDLEKELP